MNSTSRRDFLKRSTAGALGMLGVSLTGGARAGAATRRPNILFAIADDWSWPHASIWNAPEINTPAFDRVAREGCLFSNAFTAAPQCSPNRAATLTGRHIWQIEEAGTHASIFPNKFQVYPDLLEASGYFVGYTGKPWAPGDWKRGGWKRNPAGPAFNAKRLKERPATGINPCDYAGNFEDFLDKRPKDAPFCFWFGCKEPHRVYEEGSGAKAGKDPDKVKVPKFLPDVPQVRNDLLDYFLEVEWFDGQVAKMLAKLEAIGELDNTLVVVTSDNGMPFPRAKANVYEYGTHVPLAIRWPGKAKAGRVVPGVVSFIDFAPTFLEAAGVDVPAAMTGTSLLPALRPGKPVRDSVLFGRERHTHARYDNLGYPARAIRTEDFLYIRNYKPGRWPAGQPDEYHDIDSSPSKTNVLEHEQDAPVLFAMSTAKRPEEELFDIRTDPECLHNLAGQKAHENTRKQLRTRLDALLTEQGDPRMHGRGDIFESYPRVSPMRPELGGFAERGAYNPKYQPKE